MYKYMHFKNFLQSPGILCVLHSFPQPPMPNLDILDVSPILLNILTFF